MQTHINPHDPLAIRFIERFFPGGIVVSVPIEGKMKSGQCYANVIDHIKKHGGRMQLGWLLTVEPNKYVEAIHHAVWSDAESRMADITDVAFSGMTNTHSTFVIDNETDIPTDYWHPSLPSKFLLLTASAKVAAYVEVTQRLTIANGKLREAARLAGGSCLRLPDGNIGLALSYAFGSPLHILNEEVRFLQHQKMKLRGELDREAV